MRQIKKEMKKEADDEGYQVMTESDQEDQMKKEAHKDLLVI